LSNKISLNDLIELGQLIPLIPTFKPMVGEVLDAIATYKDEVERIKAFLIESTVDTKAGIYLGLIAKGVPADHAVALAIGSTNAAFKTAINSVNK
jgi:hypothetical protein